MLLLKLQTKFLTCQKSDHWSIRWLIRCWDLRLTSNYNRSDRNWSEFILFVIFLLFTSCSELDVNVCRLEVNFDLNRWMNSTLTVSPSLRRASFISTLLLLVVVAAVTPAVSQSSDTSGGWQVCCDWCSLSGKTTKPSLTAFKTFFFFFFYMFKCFRFTSLRFLNCF